MCAWAPDAKTSPVACRGDPQTDPNALATHLDTFANPPALRGGFHVVAAPGSHDDLPDGGRHRGLQRGTVPWRDRGAVNGPPMTSATRFPPTPRATIPSKAKDEEPVAGSARVFRQQQAWMDSSGAPKLEVMQSADEANALFGQLMYRSLDTTHLDMRRIRHLMRATYILLLLLYLAMFLVGIVLIALPFFEEPNPARFEARQFLLAGLGGADLLTLGLLQPTQRTKHLMGDMAQLSILMNDHQHQAILRLIQMDRHDRSSIGEAAAAIQEATRVTVDLIERYFTDESIGARLTQRRVQHTRRSLDEAVSVIDGIDPKKLDSGLQATLGEVRSELERALAATRPPARPRVPV